uniref:Methyltransferase domain-containing protein n=1 Tax=Asterionellopsis glacialis TaxID=33640 RepID=A0A7S0KZY1_9STRA|mmetsp:Transcript_1273/g.1777  ORF Transcript_1273/g.1777 Transcript_1273/m.1777 type:complete len:314 (+) Transcript_1273:162-1103(+)
MLYNKENKKNDEEKLVPMQISTSSTHHGQSSLSNGANTTMTVALFCLGFVGISFVVGSLKSSSLISSSSHQNHHQLVPYTCSWKEVAFVPHIQSGDSIYESACGIGINLLATLEILATHDIHDLTIYGNDYVQENVNLGNYVWSTEDAKLLGHKGLFCRGDSSNLDFVPSNSFDLVFTGYIDPLQDPLNLIDDESLEEDDDAPCHYQSKEFCNSDDPVYQYVMKQEQLAEEDWFASWVTEMVRIAKPGKVISVESIAEPICKNQHDWGGVDKEWWPKAVDKYKWDVDPSSIVIRQVQYPAFRLRYNVMMKKNS